MNRAQNKINPLGIQELRRLIGAVQDDAAVPREGRDIGDRVVVAAQIRSRFQMLVQYIELPLYFHRVAVAWVLPFFRSIGLEVSKAAAQVGHAAHLPE